MFEVKLFFKNSKKFWLCEDFSLQYSWKSLVKFLRSKISSVLASGSKYVTLKLSLNESITLSLFLIISHSLISGKVISVVIWGSDVSNGLGDGVGDGKTISDDSGVWASEIRGCKDENCEAWVAEVWAGNCESWAGEVGAGKIWIRDDESKDGEARVAEVWAGNCESWAGEVGAGNCESWAAEVWAGNCEAWAVEVWSGNCESWAGKVWSGNCESWAGKVWSGNGESWAGEVGAGNGEAWAAEVWAGNCEVGAGDDKIKSPAFGEVISWPLVGWIWNVEARSFDDEDENCELEACDSKKAEDWKVEARDDEEAEDREFGSGVEVVE